MTALYEVKLEAWLNDESDTPGFGVSGRWPDHETLVRLLMYAVTEVLSHDSDGAFGPWSSDDEDEHPEMRRYREGWRHEYGTRSLLIDGEWVKPL